jgi:hypothetical protein
MRRAVVPARPREQAWRDWRNCAHRRQWLPGGAAARAVDDAYCHERLRITGEYASEMLSKRDHARWGRDSSSGVEFLRQQILNALELYASRLYSLEALRASGSIEDRLHASSAPG